MKSGEMKCDLCANQKLDLCYEVPDSALGMEVYVCARCGLTQSIPRETANKQPHKRAISTSSGAGWGNIRYGKAFRIQTAAKALSAHVDLNDVRTVLDVGSNRGDFVRWIGAIAHPDTITAVEPDGRIVEDYRCLPNVALQVDRLENVELRADYYNLVYCCHTLEHAPSALAMLEQIHACMKAQAFLYLETPNIDILAIDDIFEEWFIDKHSFHFNGSLLASQLGATGFRIMWGPDERDLENITLLARKEEYPAHGSVVYDGSLPSSNQRLIATYIQKLQQNRQKLASIAQAIEGLAEGHRVALWGAGRIFDALVRYGGLKAEKVVAVVDKYLAKYVSESGSARISEPSVLMDLAPDVVVVLSRGMAQEIEGEARDMGIRRVVRFNDLAG